MRDRAMPESIPPTAVATLAHLGVKSAHRPHAAAVRELACAALSMLRSATAHTPSLHRVLLVGALGDDRVLNSTTPTGAAESLWSERLRSARWAASHAATLASLAALAAPHGVDVDDLVPAVRAEPARRPVHPRRDGRRALLGGGARGGVFLAQLV